MVLGGTDRSGALASTIWVFNSELKASETMQLKLSSIVNLYVALGGGWQYEDDANQP